MAVERSSRLTKIAQQHTALGEKYLSQASIAWLRDKMRKIKDPTQLANSIAKEQKRFVRRPNLGNLYFFRYDPKHKATLKYYDVFPLVIVIEKYDDGFLGLNLHYLPPLARAIFLDILLPYTKFDSNKMPIAMKRSLDYAVLSMSKRYAFFKPCLKRYLTDHLKSPMMKIESEEWEPSLFLPVESFRKATKSQVQKDSLNTIKKELE